MLKKILVPLDGSELAERALPYALSLTQKYEAELLLVMVLQTPVAYVLSDDMGVGLSYSLLEEGLERERNKAQAYLRQIEAELREEEIAIWSVVRENKDVADGIIDIAQQEAIDVIVKTTHGRSGPSRWVYGNVATKVLQSAPCPVFLVRVQ